MAGGWGLSIGRTVVCHSISHAGAYAMLSVSVAGNIAPLKLAVLTKASSHDGDVLISLKPQAPTPAIW